MNEAEQDPRSRKRGCITVFLLLGSIALLIGGWLFWMLYQSAARDRINAANYYARQVSKAFSAVVHDLDREKQLPRRSEEIINGQSGTAHEPGSLESCMEQYFDRPGYYAVVTDGSWHVQYALFSQHPIPPEKIRAYTPEEQRRFMNDLRADHGALIGCDKQYVDKEETK